MDKFGQIEVELQEFMGSDRSIAESAWTSSLAKSGKAKRSDEDVEKVVKYLIENKHSTPIESVVLRFWIKMPIQTDRQHMTHRLQSTSGMSARYRTMPSEFLDIPDDVREITDKLESRSQIINKYYDLCTINNNFYKNTVAQLKKAETEGLITNSDLKRCREFYRGVLPQNNMTERISIFNLRSFANYQKLRNSPHAQPEIQLVAKLMLEEVKRLGVSPIALNTLEENGWNL